MAKTPPRPTGDYEQDLINIIKYGYKYNKVTASLKLRQFYEQKIKNLKKKMTNFILPSDRLGAATEEAYMEVRRAKSIHGPQDFNSTHEGYAVLLEEVRELEKEVFFGKKECRREFKNDDDAARCHKHRLREEAIQVAAMALRIASELAPNNDEVI